MPTLARSWRRRWFLSALSGAGWWAWLASQEALAARPSRTGAPVLMPTSWPLWLDHLIPEDELTPSASQLQIDRRLWAEVLKDKDYARLARFGCQWIDRYHPEGFRGLNEDEREQLVQWMSQAPWESPQRRFFELVRDHAMKLYYLEPAARRGTPLERPPQPGGRAIDRVIQRQSQGATHQEPRDA